MMFIFCPVAFIAGYVILLRPLKVTLPKASQADSSDRVRKFLYHSLPVLLILIVMAIFTLATPLWKNRFIFTGNMAQYFPMFAGLFVSGAWVYKTGKLKVRDISEAIFNKKIIMLLLLIVAVMAYKNVLLDCGAINQMNEEMRAQNIPLIAIVIILPFIAGLVMGLAVGFVGASFPVVLGVIAGNPDFTSYIILAYVSGYTGMMISPIHMCFVLTKNHFAGSKMEPIYQKLVILCAVVFLFGLAYSAAFRILS